MNDRLSAPGSHDPVLASLERAVPIPAPLRVALAILVLLGSALFALIAVATLVPFRPLPHPVAGAVLGCGALAVATLFAIIGYRVLIGRTSRRHLLGPRVRWAFATLFALGAVGMLVRAWIDDSVVQAAQSFGTAFLGYLVARTARRA